MDNPGLVNVEIDRDEFATPFPAQRTFDVVCFSHLRWNFVFQRPQHLLTRFAKSRRVFYFEEPVNDVLEAAQPYLEARKIGKVTVCTPHLPKDSSVAVTRRWQTTFVERMLISQNIQHYVAWYYTPMALGYTERLTPLLRVYDCMDELSGFLGAPFDIKQREKELLGKCDLVFTGGKSLYEAKKALHSNIHLFPSSVDMQHFAKARHKLHDPQDQAPIPFPRFGYFGVLDERIDFNLIAQVAEAKPDWQFVMVGPVCKIKESDLPRRSNIHYLGNKPYQELPDYIASWDATILPFALNDATRFISPTKTPEYLAAGKPVLSTRIRDVERPYGHLAGVAIVDNADGFIRAGQSALSLKGKRGWLVEVDRLLSKSSWDTTWNEMNQLVNAVMPGADLTAW